MQISTRLHSLAIVTLALALTGGIAAQSNQRPERFTAFAVSLGDIRTASGATTVEINIERWSSETERQKLEAALLKKGSDALLETLRDTKSVGTIRTPDSLGYDLRYAHQEPAEDGGRRIVLGTDRPISFWEARNQPRSIDYPFTVIEIHMPRDGVGEGKLSIATRITASGSVISLENYATQPVRLREVRSTIK